MRQLYNLSSQGYNNHEKNVSRDVNERAISYKVYGLMSRDLSMKMYLMQVLIYVPRCNHALRST
jgi:hypothetical protein